ncbi:MAG: hypothetical protein V3S51_00305 [Dehalococcoidia bacterium]
MTQVIRILGVDAARQDIVRLSDSVDGVKSKGCRTCGWIVYIDNYGPIIFEDGSYICSRCARGDVGRRLWAYHEPIDYHKAERLGRRGCNVLARVPFM